MQPKLNLLKALKDWRPDCIMEAQGNKGKSVTLFRLGFDGQDEEKIQSLLRDLLGRQKETTYVIDMQGIDIISPSAAKALITGAVGIATQRRIPVIFTGVSAEALYGLQTVRNMQQTEQHTQQAECVLWAVDGAGNKHLVGVLPYRLQEILKSLEEKGPSSASDLAERSGEEASKKNINRYSVYLQELYNTGLLIREKVVGSVRTEGERNERGWTYKYRPAYDILTAPSTL